MARCNWCGAETLLYENGVPICLKCSDERHEAQRRREMNPPKKAPETPSKNPPAKNLLKN